MKQTDNTPHSQPTNHVTTSPFKILTANVNDLNSQNKRTKFYNPLKSTKIDIALVLETHSIKNTEILWQKEWTRMSFWNSGPNHQTAGIAIFLKKTLKVNYKILNTIIREEFSLYPFYCTIVSNN